MAVSAQGVSADELVPNEAATTEGNQVKLKKRQKWPLLKSR